MANAGFVDLGESILVFDSFNTQQAATELRNVIGELTGKPVSHLINSHWHGDHIRGNQAFRDVSIVATEQTKIIMQEKHPSRIREQRSGLEGLGTYIQKLEEQRESTIEEKQKLQLAVQISILKEIQLSLPSLELILPNEVFESEWCVKGTSRTVLCHTLGGGHTASDSFLYVPDANVCYIGDLVAINNHMLIVDGDIRKWISILDELNTWEIECVVPGHGPVGGKEWIAKAKDYLGNLLETAEMLRAKATTLDQIGEIAVPEKYIDWSARELYVKNLKHLVSQG
ncbi:MBL fold metallo-hydrolase [Paenibacillus planticolens]|uniref:MBL fold metallo-hydrolase n=1 Tax=Paenibacillus planticolens TaxID=2654976 RepID=A0ABX1ZMI6_9BACL|nr:MBL fold metallo-hydrolase [Paenibacillus planticolens]NOV01287.1 MBL fold metallo-hydrolase [Paenibacillus planticolens]